MEIKSVVVGSCIGAIIVLSFFMEMTIVMGLDNSTDNNCIEIDCLKEKLKRMCMEGTAPSYLDCENILRCIDAGEQKNQLLNIPTHWDTTSSTMLIRMVRLPGDY